MRRATTLVSIIAAVAGAVGSASAAVTFSNISVTGSISAPNTVTTGADDIDFAFNTPGGVVGDPVAPIRAGNIVITFDVNSTTPITTDIISLLGAISGSGTVIFNEVIEDTTPGSVGIIASTSLTIDLQNPPPRFRNLEFSRPSSQFKVKKTLFFFAPDTQGVDFANISLVEQRFVPTPGALALVAMGGLVAARRRRA